MKLSKIHKYKYRLEEDTMIATPLAGWEVEHKYFMLNSIGTLTVHKGYLWDGSSGIAWDDKKTIPASLPHDVGYQMIRLELLPIGIRKVWDDLYRDELVRHGASKFRASLHYRAVRMFGGSSCIPGDVKIPEIITL